MDRCDWCQEISQLIPVVNRDKTTNRRFDRICPSCVEVERFEHADESTWNPLGFTPSRRRYVLTSASLDEQRAS